MSFLQGKREVSHALPVIPRVAYSWIAMDIPRGTLILQSPAVTSTFSQGEAPRGGATQPGTKGRTPPLKPPKKYREEDTEVLRCKRRLDFVRLGLTMPRPHPETVAKRNERERKRVKKINSTFNTLKSRIPGALFEEKSEKKRSKVDTLRAAIDYIYNLQELLDEHDAVTAALGTGGLGTGGLGTGGLGTGGLGTAGLGTAGLGTAGLGTAGLGTAELATNSLGGCGLQGLSPDSLPSPTTEQESQPYRLGLPHDNQTISQNTLSYMHTPGATLPHSAGLVSHTPGSAYSPGSTYSGTSDSSGTEHARPRADHPLLREPSPPPLSPEDQELINFTAWF